jgi:hypothetical protein
MDKTSPPRAFNTFSPSGHVVVALPSMAAADAAVQDLRRGGFADADLVVYSADEMRALAEREVQEATLAARIGQEYNLAKARLELAASGHPFLVVPARNDHTVQAVAEAARRHGAVRAQRYGTFIIEELIDVGEGIAQVGESPDRGLDAQTVSGREKDTDHRDRTPPPRG